MDPLVGLKVKNGGQGGESCSRTSASHEESLNSQEPTRARCSRNQRQKHLLPTRHSALDTAMDKEKDQTLFGGSRSWKAADWTASDDRVRGGKSQSFLECHSSTGRFHGNLDIKTLGGAGFASQRTTGEDRSWDLSGYAGIVLDIAEADDKRYTFILKDELLPRNPDNGREQATISWEYDFKPCFGEGSLEKGGLVFVPWSALKPTYRGKEKEHADPINLKTIKRMSIMMRSFFGDQEGSFSLTLRSISAVASSPVELGRLEQGDAASATTSTSRWTRGG
ncbi:CIA30-domain-containing protein, partial [Aureobasidium melanogenum]